MTEQQINQLKRLLEQDASSQDNPELDATILAAAREQADQYARRQAHRTRFASLRFVPAIGLAVVMTLGLLLAMGQWLSVEPIAPVVKRSSQVLPIDLEARQNAPVENAQEPRIALPQLTRVLPPPINTQLKRDRVLTIYPLPDSRAVVASMTFELEQQRVAASENIQLALNDINLMLKQGQLNDARQRYDALRNQCPYCVLPDSLELLVLNHQANRLRPTDTG